MVMLRLRRNTAVIKRIFWLVDMLPTRAVNTGALFTLSVFTGRVHGPWTRVEKTQPCSRAVNTASVNRP